MRRLINFLDSKSGGMGGLKLGGGDVQINKLHSYSCWYTVFTKQILKKNSVIFS